MRGSGLSDGIQGRQDRGVRRALETGERKSNRLCAGAAPPSVALLPNRPRRSRLLLLAGSNGVRTFQALFSVSRGSS